LLPFVAATTFGASFALAAAPNLCDHGRWTATAARAPAAVITYLDSLGDSRFDLRAACAQWAGTFSKRHQFAADSPQSAQKLSARLIMYPAEGGDPRELYAWLKQTGYVYQLERSRNFVVATFSRYMTTDRLIAATDRSRGGGRSPPRPTTRRPVDRRRSAA